MAKVLLVEDDNNLREIYQARLTAEGYDIVAAQNGEEALVSAKQNKPDLIISDVMMPRISGFEMLDILRNTDELKHTKVIMLTALGQAEDQARADNLGADKYLVKSQVTLEDIVNAAKELLGEDVATLPMSAPVPETTTVTEPAAVLPAPATDSAPASNEPALVPASELPQPDITVVVPPTPANPTPPTVISAPVAPEPVFEPAISTVTPAPDATLVSEPATAAPLAPEPTVQVVPASIVPEPNTTVVVPPAPANPEPPIVTAIPLPSAPDAAPDTTPAAEASVTEAAPQSIEAEEAALKAQIEGFATQSAETPLETAPSPTPDETRTESNDEALANAVEQLNGSIEPDEKPESADVTSTSSEDAAEEPAPEAPSNTLGDSANVAHKKVIQPISSNLSSGSNLDELLAKEEAQQAAPLANPAINGAAGQPPAPQSPATPGQSFDPNSISL